MKDFYGLIIIIMLLGLAAEVYFLAKPRRNSSVGAAPILVDTSVLMDGRVTELAKTGFLLGKIIVPRSVLTELQLLADGADHDKRERARFGMDVVKELKDILKSSFELYDDNIRLLKLAKEMDAAVLTLDYNLNKVAQVDGVKVLNINELAKSLRMSYLPGDELDLELSQKGQDSHQAVGYLKDGTMVVVENAKRYIGQTKKIEIIRSLQTDAGKMMFAKLVVEQKKPVKQKTSVPKKRTNGRSKTSAQHEAELINLVNKQ